MPANLTTHAPLAFFPTSMGEESPPYLLDSKSNPACLLQRVALPLDPTPNELQIDPRIQATPDLFASELETPESWSILDLAQGETCLSPAITRTVSITSDQTSPSMYALIAAASNCTTYNQHAEVQTNKRRAHYRVEKRYRANLNDKISALDDILPKPTVREKEWTEEGSRDKTGAAEETSYHGDGLTIKRSKGEVLTRAFDYILFLQQKVSSQENEIRDLKDRMRAAKKALELGSYQ
ncbi:hypothetical protein CDV55_100556 [Aspergillus turcosus]|uniref:BHLH domain-containing protein n=1 Tax=Aspergillus turcosus TaxID=1245748 RepID=A0A229X4H6_9EURO|nr:hypothetical protein CDV55_100556 [Aspergillus turcosus]RLM00573.1 hypothetical protein CFD26_108412 [Aspergillus turcosus]